MRKIKKQIDLKLIGYLVIITGIIEFSILLKNIYLKSNGIRFRNWSWQGLFSLVHIQYYIFTILYISFIAIMIKLMIEKQTKLIYTVIFHFFFAFFLGPYLFIFFSIYGTLTGQESFSDFINHFFLTKYIAEVDINLLTYIVLIVVIYMYYYFNRIKKVELQKVELQIQLSNTKLSFLKSQLHPHFLFNTLNSIHSLMRVDKRRSQNMLTDMGDLLKEMMNTEDDNLIELQNELLLLNKYLNIKKIRFSDDLKINLDVENNLENALVPSMLLQPIVENSIKYGYSKDHLQLTLSIKIFKKENQVIFILKNNGRSLEKMMDKLKKNGTGLKNIIERLETLYSDDYTFDMYNNGKSVITKISVPYRLLN